MINVLLAGVGGQGTVLAAKVLAQAAQDKGWQVRTAETIGMAQRGGNVTSHVRMGSNGEQIDSPLIACNSAQMIIAFEPAEAAGALKYLASDGVVITASTGIQPVTAALSETPYRASGVVSELERLLEKRVIVVDDQALIGAAGTAKTLNTLLLAAAVKAQRLPISFEELRAAIQACVKPQFIEVNFKAISVVENVGAECL